MRPSSETVKHFAERKDEIVLSYFGEDGVKRIVDSIVRCLLSPLKLKEDARILDVGASPGFFTIRVVDNLRQYLPEASFYMWILRPSCCRF